MAKVTLHVYDVTNLGPVAKANKFLKAAGTGAFHAAIEVFGTEWSYGACDEGTGVYSSEPGTDEQHQYNQAIDMGSTALSEAEADALVQRLQGEWQGADYRLLKHNCTHFSDAMCQALGCGPIPSWVTNLAAAGYQVKKVGKGVKDGAQVAGIITAAKAMEVNERYHIAEQVADADQKLGLTRGALKGVDNAGKLLDQIEQKYDVSGKVAGAADKALGKAEKAGSWLGGLLRKRPSTPKSS